MTAAQAIPALVFFTANLLNGAKTYVLAVIEHGSRRVRLPARPSTRPGLDRAADPPAAPNPQASRAAAPADRRRYRTGPFPVQQRDRAGGVTHEYCLVA